MWTSNDDERRDLNRDHAFNHLSENETTNNINTGVFDDDFHEDFMSKYIAEADEDGSAFDNTCDDLHQDDNEEDDFEEDQNGETLTEQQTEFANAFINMETSATSVRKFDEVDTSVILLMIKKKHRCTTSLINDVLKLLAALKIPHVPSSWHKLKGIIKRTEETPQKEQQRMIDSFKCTNHDCSFYSDTLIPPHTFMVMSVQQQIEQILKSIDQDDLSISIQMTIFIMDVYTKTLYVR